MMRIGQSREMRASCGDTENVFLIDFCVSHRIVLSSLSGSCAANGGGLLQAGTDCLMVLAPGYTLQSGGLFIECDASGVLQYTVPRITKNCNPDSPIGTAPPPPVLLAHERSVHVESLAPVDPVDVAYADGASRPEGLLWNLVQVGFNLSYCDTETTSGSSCCPLPASMQAQRSTCIWATAQRCCSSRTTASGVGSTVPGD